MDPWDVKVTVPIWQLVQLEVSMLKLVQMFHEAGVNSICQQMYEMHPDEDPETFIEQAIETYNNLIERQQDTLDDILDGVEDLEFEEDLEDVEEDLFDVEEENAQPHLFDIKKDKSSETLH